MRRLAILAAPWLAACALLPEHTLVTLSDGRYAMGTVLEITLVAEDEGRARAALADLFAVAERLEANLSSWQPESEVSRLNRAAGRGRRALDPEVAELLRLSRRYAELTHGGFDVTVGPLVELWSEAARRGAPPTPAEIAVVLERVGWQHLRVHDDDSAELLRGGVRVELGGIAKGYALDRMLPVLEAHGIERALLNFGQSSSWALGEPDGAGAWRLLARGPGDGMLGVLNLEDRALSISGSLGQWVRIGGRRYGHVFDPRTGRALEPRRQALVLAPDATLAEALSKAVLVLGEREGLALVEAREGCEALLVDADAGTWRTSGWDAAAGFEPL